MSDDNQQQAVPPPVPEGLLQLWNNLIEQAEKQSLGSEREAKLRHQFQGKWDERERLHEQDLTELRQRLDKQVQAERTQKEELEKRLIEVSSRKEWLERELDRVNRELVALRQDAEVVLGWGEIKEMQRIHKLQADQILKANVDKQELRNQIRMERERSVEKLKVMEGMIRDIRTIIVSWENEGGNQHE